MAMEVIRWWCVLCLCLLSSWVTASETASTQVRDDLVGAVCIIRHDNQIVMLSEVITKKLSLPGGYIDKPDTPKEAAAREALEESGIQVHVGDLLQYRGRAAIYACQATSPILVSSFRDKRGFPIVASWFSKHFASEVERVYLIDPQQVTTSDYRYASDVLLLPGWMARTPNSDVLEYDQLDDKINLLHQYEVRHIQAFQHAVEQWPPLAQVVFEAIAYVLNLPGEVWFIMLVVVLTAGCLGTKPLVELLFLLLIGLFTTSLLKHGIASPRPFFALPELQRIDASGFGFPSGHTLMATLLWGGVWHVMTQRAPSFQKIIVGVIVALLIIGQGAARVWFGVQFISDVVITMMLGIMIVSSLLVWRTHEPPLQTYLYNRWFWLFLTMAVGIIASYTLVPAQAYIFAMMLGIFLSVEFASKQMAESTGLPVPKALLSCVIIGGITGILYGALQYIAEQSTVSLIVLGIKASGCLVITLWLVAGTAWLHRRLRA
ncbi:phosphatase PAP2 family protein [Photobacterium japonica]|uniref:phosphatase PAP2 family protein n=1 Tax=Photobacterium japonica TaxID=2910235 RepID=UPI003D145F5E